MSKPISLSHSSRGKYDTCPQMYKLHYLDKIRPNENNSTLLFGGAVDKAAEEYLHNRNRGTCFLAFKTEWDKANEIEVTYVPADFDAELLGQSDNEHIIKDTTFTSVSDLVKAGTEKERIAYANWVSLYYKAQLMLGGFIDWVDENVAEVLGTQIPIDLEDEQGNKVTGMADFVIKIHGYDNPVLVDLKTSARYYDRASVKESEQLGLYYFYLKQTKFPDMERAAYLVLCKQIKKNRTKTCKKCGTVTHGREQSCAVGGKGKNRCGGDFVVDIFPEAVVQYIHDEIPQDFIDQTINKFNISVEAIQAGKFEPCWTACDSYFGRKCPYFEYCRSGSMEGLVQKEKK